MISEAELSRLSALIKMCDTPHCGNGPRNSLTSALHQIAPALIPELRQQQAQIAALREALQETVADLECESLSGDDAATQAAMNRIYAALAKLGEGV